MSVVQISFPVDSPDTKDFAEDLVDAARKVLGERDGDTAMYVEDVRVHRSLFGTELVTFEFCYQQDVEERSSVRPD